MAIALGYRYRVGSVIPAFRETSLAKHATVTIPTGFARVSQAVAGDSLSDSQHPSDSPFMMISAFDSWISGAWIGHLPALHSGAGRQISQCLQMH